MTALYKMGGLLQADKYGGFLIGVAFLKRLSFAYVKIVLTLLENPAGKSIQRGNITEK
jgi:hypothetical protein